MRRKIFDIIEVADEGNKISAIYDYIMMVIIIGSLIPLAFKTSNRLFDTIDLIATCFFILDYILRLLCADLKLGKGRISFVLYPFTFMAIIDLLCIIPSLGVVSSSFRLLKVFRLFRTFRVFRSLRIARAFKFMRYSKSLEIIINVIRNQKEPLLAVGSLAIGYILISALVIFNVEPDTFENFFSAIYWATVSLTTMGYGDIYPISNAGRIITMLSSFIGIAIVALPAGIITAGYMDEIQKNKSDETESSKK